MLTIKYRLVEPRLRPRRTKLEMPGVERTNKRS
jgi:hypothetical protein